MIVLHAMIIAFDDSPFGNEPTCFHLKVIINLGKKKIGRNKKGKTVYIDTRQLIFKSKSIILKRSNERNLCHLRSNMLSCFSSPDVSGAIISES